MCYKFMKLLLPLIILPACIVTVEYEYRSLDGSNNNIAEPKAGTPKAHFFRNKPNGTNYAGDNGEMIPSPGNYVLGEGAVAPKCKDPRAEGIFPLPRCISNVLD